MATKKTAGTTTASKAPAKKTAGVNGAAEAPKAIEKKAAVSKVSTLKRTTEKAEPSHAEIAHLAHTYWKERGHHHGSHEADWIRAEKELKG